MARLVLPILLGLLWLVPLGAPNARAKTLRDCPPGFEPDTLGDVSEIHTADGVIPVGADYAEITNDDGVPTRLFDPDAAEPRKLTLRAGTEVTLFLDGNEDPSSGLISLFRSRVSDCRILLGDFTAAESLPLEIVESVNLENGFFRVVVRAPARRHARGFTKLVFRYDANMDYRVTYVIPRVRVR